MSKIKTHCKHGHPLSGHGACNLGIGHFHDDPALCRKAEQYLLRHAEEP